MSDIKVGKVFSLNGKSYEVIQLGDKFNPDTPENDNFVTVRRVDAAGNYLSAPNVILKENVT
jgi:hypothetical protein